MLSGRGWGEFGRLGHGDTTSCREPTPLSHDLLRGTVMISCGGHHTVAVTEDGQVLSWGWGSNGQLGNGSTYDEAVPTEVKGLGSQRVAAVACGYYHTAVVTEDGLVLCWGKGNSGQLGLGDDRSSLTPLAISSLRQHKIRDVSCGMAHTLAISEEGLLFAWGSGADGQLGVGPLADGRTDAHEPLLVQGIEGRVSSVAGM